DPVGERGLVIAAGVVEIMRRVAVEQRPPLVRGAPGQGAVRRRFIEDQQVPFLAGDVVDQILVLFPELDLARQRIVPLVAAGNSAETAVTLVHVRELVLEDYHSGSHLPILEVVRGETEVVVPGAMEDQPPSALRGEESER